VISEWKSPDFQNLPQQELVLLIGLYACLSSRLEAAAHPPADRAGPGPSVA